MRRDAERRDIEQDQDDADREAKGRREATKNPSGRDDPRDEDHTPQEPFSGSER